MTRRSDAGSSRRSAWRFDRGAPPEPSRSDRGLRIRVQRLRWGIHDVGDVRRRLRDPVEPALATSSAPPSSWRKTAGPFEHLVGQLVAALEVDLDARRRDDPRSLRAKLRPKFVAIAPGITFTTRTSRPRAPVAVAEMQFACLVEPYTPESGRCRRSTRCSRSASAAAIPHGDTELGTGEQGETLVRTSRATLGSPSGWGRGARAGVVDLMSSRPVRARRGRPAAHWRGRDVEHDRGRAPEPSRSVFEALHRLERRRRGNVRPGRPGIRRCAADGLDAPVTTRLL